VDLQREEDSVNQDGEKLAEQIMRSSGHHLDFKTLTIVSDAPAETAKPPRRYACLPGPGRSSKK